MKRFNVLWIDDDPSESFLNEAYEYGLDIDVKTCHDDGIAALKNPNNSYDAIILDANCKITNEESEKPSLDSLTESILEVHSYCTASQLIPWYVYTGGGYEGFDNLESRISSKRQWDDRKYYKKPIQRYELFDNLKKAIEEINSSEWQIRNEYSDVFEICSDKYIGYQNAGRLLKLLLALKNKDIQNPIHFNSIRKIIEDFFEKLHQLELLPREQNNNGKIEKVSFNGKSRFLSNLSIIPIYIQRNIHSVVSITQDASHSKNNVGNELKSNNLQVDTDIQSNKAPYLLHSTIYELLNILSWSKTFIDDNSNLESNKTKIDLSPKKIIDFSKIKDTTLVVKNEITSSITELEPIITKETLTGVITTKLPSDAFFAPDDKSDIIRIQGKLVSSLKVGMKVSVLVKIESINNKLTRSVIEIITTDPINDLN